MSSAVRSAVVLGAGPAGLAAAWELALAGCSVTILEKEPLAGGLCATVEREGFRFDHGGHRLLSTRPLLVRRLRELAGDLLLERERSSVVALGGARYRYPLEARELARTLPPSLALRGLAEAALGLAWSSPAERDFAGWVRSRFGPTLYELFFAPYTRKLWGLEPEALSSDWASERISVLNLADLGLLALGLGRRAPRSHARRYLYPRRGMGSLFQRLVARLEALGVRLWTEAAAVSAVRSEDGSVRSLSVHRGGRYEELPCDALFSTAPLGALLSVLGERSPAIDDARSRLRCRAMRFLNVCLRGTASPLGETWIYTPDPAVPATRLQEPAQRSPEMVPEGCASLMIELPCEVGDARWSAPEETLWREVEPTLRPLGVAVEGRVIGLFSSRSADAYPVYTHGYARHRERLTSAVGTAPNVWTFGRQGLFRYAFLDTAMEQGFAAARAALRGARAESEALLEVENLHEVSSALG